MNGFELLAKLGITEELIPQSWRGQDSETSFHMFLETSLKKLLGFEQEINTRLPLLDNSSGILKGSVIFEVVSYRDVSKPLPLSKAVETTGEEAIPQFTSSTRTFKLLLTDGSPDRTFVAMEYEQCPQLNQIRLGAKIQLKDCYYHNGILLLTPRCLHFIGAPSEIGDEF